MDVPDIIWRLNEIWQSVNKEITLLRKEVDDENTQFGR